MKQCKIKIEDGKIYLPSNINKELKQMQTEYEKDGKTRLAEIVFWFTTYRKTNLIKRLNLTEEDLKFVDKSNEVCFISTEPEFTEHIRSVTKGMPRAKAEKALRYIYRNVWGYNPTKQTSMAIPKMYTNFLVGDFVLIEYYYRRKKYFEIWDEVVWNNIKQYLKENNRKVKIEETSIKQIKTSKNTKEQ